MPTNESVLICSMPSSSFNSRRTQLRNGELEEASKSSTCPPNIIVNLRRKAARLLDDARCRQSIPRELRTKAQETICRNVSSDSAFNRSTYVPWHRITFIVWRIVSRSVYKALAAYNPRTSRKGIVSTLAMAISCLDRYLRRLSKRDNMSIANSNDVCLGFVPRVVLTVFNG